MSDNRQLVKASRDLFGPDEHVGRTPPPLNYNYEPAAEDGAHLRDYWRSVRKHTWLVLGVLMLGTMFAAIYVARKPDVFEAQARVQVDLENARQPISTPRNNSPVVLSNLGNDPTYFNTQLQILTGPGLLRRVVRTLDLEHNQDFLRPQRQQNRTTLQNLWRMVGLGGNSNGSSNANNEKADEIPIADSVASATLSDDLHEDLVEAQRLAPYVRALQDSLKVEPVRETRLAVRDTRLIDIRFIHSDPLVAARVVNAIAETFVRSNLERRSESTASTGTFLERRVAELQDRIRNGEERLINYAQRNQILSLDASQNTVVERLTGLNRQLLDAENERKLAEAAYQAAARPGAADALASGDNKQITEAENQLVTLRQRRAQLLVDNTEEWPEVKEINEQIAVLEKQVQDTRTRATSNVITNLETRYRQAFAREQSLRTAFNQQRGETLTQNEAAVNYRIIQQEVETNRELLNGLLQSSRENEVVRAETPNNIYIVDHALAPDAPVGPARLRVVVLAFFFSLASGVGLALLLEYLNDTIRSTEDVERALRLPALAVIPSVGGLARRRLLPVASALRPANGNKTSGKELIFNAEIRSPLAEAYRQLRTSILLSKAGHPPKTLLVTSSIPSEGKTTTAANMAVSLAQTGASVLIIDADMRRPRQHAIFEVENRRGLSTLLSSDTSKAEVLTVIQRHEALGIYVLPSGPIPPNPAELLGSEQMRQLITTLEAAFNYIIIDSPPAASFTDSVLLSTLVDGVLLVIHSGRSSREITRRSQQLLQDVGAKIIGVVLNNVDLHKQDYNYYQHYQQYYYQSDADADHIASGTQA